MDRAEKLKLVYLLVALFGLICFCVLSEPLNGLLGRLWRWNCITDDVCEDDLRYYKNIAVTMILVAVVYLMFSLYHYYGE